MPIYEYKCESCGAVRDSIEKVGTTTIVCKCGGTATKTMGSFVTNVHGLPNGFIGTKAIRWQHE